jgi:GNAT superfamily N-acetyltransferase
MSAPASLRIAPATPADVPAILSLIRGLADYERLADYVVATDASLHDALFGPSPAAEAVLASIDGRTAGYALWFQTFSTFEGKRGIYLEDLYVNPEFRGQGIGRALLAHLARVAVERGCTRLQWAVLDWNTPAIAFYRGLGAVPVDDWHIYKLSGDALKALAGE